MIDDIDEALGKPNGKPTVLPLIRCGFLDASVRCLRCVEAQGSCDTPPALLTGNTADANQVIIFVRGLTKATLPGSEAHAYTDETRTKFVALARDFLGSFDAIVKAHSSAFCINQGKAAGREAEQTYHESVERRRATMIGWNPHPGYSGEDQPLIEWRKRVLPRLLAGDVGFVPWKLAIQALIDGVVAGLEEEGLSEEEITAVLAGLPVMIPTAYLEG